jgi:hypothetical protein
MAQDLVARGEDDLGVLTDMLDRVSREAHSRLVKAVRLHLALAIAIVIYMVAEAFVKHGFNVVLGIVGLVVVGCVVAFLAHTYSTYVQWTCALTTVLDRVLFALKISTLVTMLGSIDLDSRIGLAYAVVLSVSTTCPIKSWKPLLGDAGDRLISTNPWVQLLLAPNNIGRTSFLMVDLVCGRWTAFVDLAKMCVLMASINRIFEEMVAYVTTQTRTSVTHVLVSLFNGTFTRTVSGIIASALCLDANTVYESLFGPGPNVLETFIHTVRDRVESFSGAGFFGRIGQTSNALRDTATVVRAARKAMRTVMIVQYQLVWLASSRIAHMYLHMVITAVVLFYRLHSISTVCLLIATLPLLWKYMVDTPATKWEILPGVKPHTIQMGLIQMDRIMHKVVWMYNNTTTVHRTISGLDRVAGPMSFLFGGRSYCPLETIGNDEDEKDKDFLARYGGPPPVREM